MSDLLNTSYIGTTSWYAQLQRAIPTNTESATGEDKKQSSSHSQSRGSQAFIKLKVTNELFAHALNANDTDTENDPFAVQMQANQTQNKAFAANFINDQLGQQLDMEA